MLFLCRNRVGKRRSFRRPTFPILKGASTSFVSILNGCKYTSTVEIKIHCLLLNLSLP